MLPVSAAICRAADGADKQASARRQFLAIEAVARLPAEQRAKQLPQFYRELAPPVLGAFTEMALSAAPARLLVRDRRFAADHAFENYADELADAAKTMSPEEVADRIEQEHGRILLPVAARRRAMQVLMDHKAQTSALVSEDLKNDDPATVRRAMLTIQTLKLADFTDQVVALYLADGKHADAAHGALVWLNDPAAAAPLLADIKRDPKRLERHHLLLSGLLRDRPADPILVKFLEADDARSRFQAATALGECRDAALAPHVKRLLADSDARIRAVAAGMAFRLPEEAFASTRADLVSSLEGESDDATRLELACGFAARNDLVAARPLLGLWSLPTEPPNGYRVMQAVGHLAGTTFDYDPRQWGPLSAQNRRAMARFDAWIRQQTPP